MLCLFSFLVCFFACLSDYVYIYIYKHAFADVPHTGHTCTVSKDMHSYKRCVDLKGIICIAYN